MKLSCPTCTSPDPKRHPAMQFEGEVQVCPDPFHPITEHTITDEQIRELEEMVMGGLIDVGPIDDCGDPDRIIDDCVTALDEAGLATEHEAHAVARREARARCAEILNARRAK